MPARQVWWRRARGALGHWVTLTNGKIERYQIIAPTTWNFSPRDRTGLAGPLEQALEGVETGRSVRSPPRFSMSSAPSTPAWSAPRIELQTLTILFPWPG